MTKTINLLPWRETSRQLRKQAMLATLLGASVLSVMLVGFVYMLSSSNLEEIIREKKIIEKEIAGLGRSLIEIKGLERKKRDLISKNRVLQNVQSSRSEIVRLFDESVNAVPMGVTLTTLERKDNLISISGVAGSNHDVAALMKNLDESYLFTRAKLKEIGGSGSGAGVGNIFYMEVELDVVRD